MKVVYEYSHLGGSEILKVRFPEIEKDIKEIISEVKGKRIKESKEKTMKGKMLYSPKDMNQQFKEAFESRGYRELKDIYTITLRSTAGKAPFFKSGMKGDIIFIRCIANI